MKKRLGTVLLLALFVISSMMPTSAATAEIWNEARASHYFDAYMLGISAKGGGEMAVSFGVFGTDTMDKIGVYSLRIESEIAPNKWIEEFTVYGSSDPDTFYAMDTIQHGGDFYFAQDLSIRIAAKPLHGMNRNVPWRTFAKAHTKPCAMVDGFAFANAHSVLPKL